MPDTSLTGIDREAEHRRALCRAALANAFSVCQVNLAGRSNWTATDFRLYDAVWSLMQRTFDPGNPEQEASGDHIPQGHAQPEPTGALKALESTLMSSVTVKGEG